MSSMSSRFIFDTTPSRTASELIKSHRERLAQEESERAYQRSLDLAEQCSSLSTPDERIRKWEKVHGLRMPSDAMHPVLEVIAIDTRLTLAEVQQEQRARLTQRAAVVAS